MSVNFPFNLTKWMVTKCVVKASTVTYSKKLTRNKKSHLYYFFAFHASQSCSQQKLHIKDPRQKRESETRLSCRCAYIQDARGRKMSRRIGIVFARLQWEIFIAMLLVWKDSLIKSSGSRRINETLQKIERARLQCV